MKRLIIAMLLLTIAAYVHAASFDCTKAAKPVEKLICSEDEVSRLDEQMVLSYKEALAKSSDSKILRSEQRLWLANVRNKCRESTCLKCVYGERISVLNGIGPAEKKNAQSEEERLADMWKKKRSSASKEVRDLLNECDRLNEACRGGSGDDPKTWEACDKRGILYSKITRLGWCWGNGSKDQAGYQMYWQHCVADRGRPKK